MAKGKFTNRMGFANDAEFRTVNKKISDIFAACGFVKHWNSVDWTTATKPSGANQTPYSEVWRFDDALQATRPVFIKISYGSAESYDYLYSIYIQVSNGADNLGNLTGNLNSIVRRIQSYTSSYWNSIDWQNIYSGGEANRMFMMLNYDSDWLSVGYISGGFSIERTRNADGTVNGDGVAIFFWHYSTSYNQNSYRSNQVLDFENNFAHYHNTNEAALNVMDNGRDATFYNNIVSTIPIYPAKYGSFLYNPMLGMLSCLDRDFVNDITTQIDHYGVERSYMKIGYGGDFWKWNANNGQRDRTRGLLLWE